MYKMLEHESEIGIEACGNNREESFSEASKGLYSIMTDIKRIRRIKSVEFSCKSEKVDELLIECLNELVYITSTGNMLFSDFEYHIIKSDDNVYEAICSAYGEEIDFSRHVMHVEVKAVTYSGLKVWEKGSAEKKDFCVRFIADI